MTTLETLLSDPDTAGVWNLVSDQSTISFKIRNMWGLINVKGRFTDFSGDGQITGKGAIFGRVDIQVASLHTGIRKRDEHLRSADFFDAERFPEISVVVTALEPTAGNAADLRATFTIKGVTARCRCRSGPPCSTTASVRVSAKTEVDRAQFDLGWNRLGMIGERATVSADACFVRAPR